MITDHSDSVATTSAEEVGFGALMARLRAGDEAAAREFYERWVWRLMGLTRARLGRSIVVKEDPQDIVQSVYRSFFRRYGAGHFQVEDWHDVWALLVTIVLRKCANRRQFYAAECRTLKRETATGLDDRAADDPTPEDEAMLAEMVQRLLLSFPPAERAVVELSLQGYTVKEIGKCLNRAERSVYRIREHVRSWLELQAIGD
ncbi:RNA polymerase sigma factor [Singulisphaera acidiphila]|uniref:DNA-directed RNA polymerase specialized sigma subunit, sigma24 n=1 Tax=Singulisphaera acidiphila (strain ATCC BAA-1392 / DSM 18658 / VKM B-2454 / MOB10) TaxID=886293 RepID=L0DH37_SINAD|nr:ECF-type sigma factor [Singulisphaera acidiphila]AGA27976.1 DNA-directed RNA polymerase specialized sigma subunit, sigma24 [Singulisphaera acidiphila DSM 18658]